MENFKFDAYKKKLQGICDENNLVFRFRQDKYPISLTICPTNGVGEQMSMLEQADEVGYRSPEAKIVFTFEDGELEYQMSETFSISDVLFNKIKRLFKNMHYLWLQYFQREVIDKLSIGPITTQNLPTVEDIDKASDEAGDMGGENIDGMESLETEEAPDLDDMPDDDETGESTDPYPYEESDAEEQ